MQQDLDDLEDRYNVLKKELRKFLRSLPQKFKAKITEKFLSELAHSLMDETVYEIVKSLQEVQNIKEGNFYKTRLSLENSHISSQEEMIKKHHENLTKENRINPQNVASLNLRQSKEIEEMNNKYMSDLLNLDREIIDQLDMEMSDQQVTLERVGVPGFFVTRNPDDIQLQMDILNFILDDSKKMF